MSSDKKGVKTSIIWILIAILIAAYPLVFTIMDRIAGREPKGIDIQPIVTMAGDEAQRNVIGEIGEGRSIRQSFLCTTDRLSSIRLFVGTYGRSNSGYVIARLLDGGTEKVIHTWTQDVSSLRDGKFMVLNCTGIDIGESMKGKQFIVEVTGQRTSPGNAITMFASTVNTYSEGTLHLEGKIQRGDLCFVVMGVAGEKSFFLTRVWLRVIAAIGAEMLLYMIYRRYVRKGGSR